MIIKEMIDIFKDVWKKECEYRAIKKRALATRIDYGFLDKALELVGKNYPTADIEITLKLANGESVIIHQKEKKELTDQELFIKEKFGL